MLKYRLNTSKIKIFSAMAHSPARRAVALFCAAVLFFAFTACGKTAESAAKNSAPDTTAQAEPQVNTPDFFTPKSPHGTAATFTAKDDDNAEKNEYTGELVIITNDEDLPEIPLSGNVFSFSFMLDGFVYQMPAPLWHFTENGWTYTEDSAEIINPAEYIETTLKKNDAEISVKIANNSNTPLHLASCSVAGIVFTQSPAMPKFSLPGGVTFGYTLNNILQALGPADTTQSTEEPEKSVSYTAGRNAFWQLTLGQNNALQSALIWCPYSTTAPHISPDDLPPEVLEYSAPSTLGTSWANYNILYSGKLYALPAPVYAFLQDGWTLRDDGFLEPGQWVMRICLQKGNQVLRTTLHNYSQTPQPLASCFVTMVEWSATSADIPLSLPGGIGNTSTYNEITAAYGPPHILDTSGMNTWDIIYYAPDGIGQLVCRFSRQDDTLADLELWHQPSTLNP